MLVLLLLVLCVCFHVACVMYLHLTSVQVGLTDLLLQHSAQKLHSSVRRVRTDAIFFLLIQPYTKQLSGKTEHQVAAL